MQIHCPLCSTSIDITEAHLGQKARCLGCQAKFVIPTTVGGQFEILERGNNPPAAQVAPATAQATPSAPATAAAAPAASTQAVRTAPATQAARKVATPARAAGARTYRPPVRKKGGAGAAIFWLILLAGCGGGAWFLLQGGDDKKVADSGGADAEPSRTLSQVRRPSTPTPEPEPSRPEPADDNVLDLGVAAVAPPDAPPAGDTPPSAPERTPLEPDKIERALAFLKSPQPNKRQGAFTAFRKLGDAYKEDYRPLLTQAREHHLQQLGDKAFDQSVGQNTLTSFDDARREWMAAAETALQMVGTDWKQAEPNDYKRKWAEMDAAFEEAERLYGRVENAAKGAGGKEIEPLEALAATVADFDAELAWCDGKEAPPAPELTALIGEAGGADGFVKALSSLAGARRELAEAEANGQWNRDCNWASAGYKSFAALLNTRRAALGLRTLRLDEKLSDACEAHSGDMLFQGYFSHTGADGSNFGQRARRAGFSGSPMGECIFQGSAAADAAHKAWWYSDGHRKIMYANGPTVLGLGTADSYWTLNTGKQ